MLKRSKDFVSMQQALKEMLVENNLQKGITELDIKEAWKEIMGSGVMAYTKEVNFKNGVLVVQLSSATLREELSYGKDKIIDMLNNHLDRSLINNIKLL